MKIYTITLSPAYDVHAEADHLALHKENFAHVTRRDAGGKGVNVSRALTCNGVDNTAIVVLGRDNCADFMRALDRDKMTYIALETDGRIRENLTIHSDVGEETRISPSGSPLDSSVLSEIEQLIPADADTIITFTGSVPQGVEMSEIKKLLSRLKNAGAKVVIDSRSFTLTDLIDVSPWLIKPNREEIEIYLGKEVEDFADCIDPAKELCAGGIENVMISLGKFGALLVTADTVAKATPPDINALSTIGAGDSTIAGFISAYCEGKSAAERLKIAVSYGTAACLTPGTTPPTEENVAEIYKRVKIEIT